MAKSRWISLVEITLWCSVLVHRPTFHVEAISTSFQGQQHQPSLQISPKELRRLRAKGLEILPNGNSISSSSVSEEPSCDELRAMWRYYRRNARAAELTNEIPKFQLQDIFWGLEGSPGEPKGFGLLKGSRGRPRFKPKGPRNPLYGKVLLKESEKSSDSGQRRRPMQEVIQLIGGPSTAVQSTQPHKSEPTLLLAPPPEPTPKSGIDRIRDMLRDERVQEGHGDNSEKPSSQGQAKEYGKLVLSPPTGTDGRVANKPRELMTPFERIRFGHADDLFNDEAPRRRPILFPVMKRRNGFIALPMLNRQRSYWRPFAMSPRAVATVPQRHPHPSSIPARYDDSIIILQNSNGGELKAPGDSSLEGTPPRSSQSNVEASFQDGVVGGVGDGKNLLSLSNEYEVETGPIDVLLAKEPLTVEETLPLCSDVKDESCSANSDCSCLGHGLYRCQGGQCQILSLNEAYEDADGSSSEFWHTEPLSALQLGAWSEGGSSHGVAKDTKRKRAADTKRA